MGDWMAAAAAGWRERQHRTDVSEKHNERAEYGRKIRPSSSEEETRRDRAKQQQERICKGTEREGGRARRAAASGDLTKGAYLLSAPKTFHQ